MAIALSRSDINGGSNVDLGNVIRESHNKDSGMIIIPEPLSGSANTRLIDFSGTTMKITIEGIIVNSTLQTLSDKVRNLYSFLSGDQSTTATFTSDIINTYSGGSPTTISVKVVNVSGQWSGGEPTAYSYLMELVQASTDI